MATYLIQDIIDNAYIDFNYRPRGNTYSSKAAHEASARCSHRKRKHTSASPLELSNGIAFEADAESRKLVTPVSVKIAGLRALEALLTVGGSLRSECWRSDVDHLLITVATNACDEGWANERKCSSPTEESTFSRAEFQLAALQALLASLLSPARVRPPHLSQGLELFRRGKQEIGTELSVFCARALLALEVLIHPRALPLVDIPVGKSSRFDEGLNGGNKRPNEDDGEFDWWLIDDEANGEDAGNLDKHRANTNQLVRGSTEDSPGEKHPITDSAASCEVAGGNQLSFGTDVEMQLVGRDESMAEPDKEPDSRDGVSSAAEAASASNHGKDAGDATESLAVHDGGGTGAMLSYDSGSDSLDSLPPIVDADPDSD